MTDDRCDVYLAPMAGATDRAMRVLCRECGARFVTTEMVSAQAVFYNDKKTYSIAAFTADEQPCAVQLFGSSPQTMAYAAAKLTEILPVKPCAFDINMGCPVKKIVSNGEGSALMRDIPLAARIVYEVVRATEIPVTVKMRAGFSTSEKNAPDLARAVQDSGCFAICVHGRTREQLYEAGCVDYDIIAQVKRSVHIPVYANGDLDSGEKFARIIEYTGCDGGAVGRAALGNPFIFEEISARLRGEPYEQPSTQRRINTALRHLSMLVEDKGDTGVLEARRHMSWYTKGLPGGADVRNLLHAATSEEQMRDILLRFADSLL